LFNGIKIITTMTAAIPTIFIALIAADLGRYLSAQLALITAMVLIYLKVRNKLRGSEWELGNSGTMFCGAVLAIISISGAVKSIAFISLILPVIILGVPLINGFVGFISVLARRKKLTQLRTKMLHHLLLEWGLTEKESRMVFYFTSFLFGLVAVLLANIATDQSLIIILLVLFFLAIGLQELRGGKLREDRLNNVKLLKDIELNLYQIKDIIRIRVLNGNREKIKDELQEIEEVISGKVPDYMKQVLKETAVTKEEEKGVEEEVEDMINLIEDVIASYRPQLKNLDYILEEYRDELEEMAENLDEVYLRLK
ncbi:MAG: hypothetical protein ACOC4L_04070, partial [Halanaerobium sp.]